MVVASAPVPAAAHGWVGEEPESHTTVPNRITAARTALAVALGAVALAAGSTTFLAAGYAAYWLGDIADGYFARRLDQETRFGAVLDIVCDRVCTVVLVSGLIGVRPVMGAPLELFLVQFVGIDLLLSLGFLRWPLLSPNYFHLVDPAMYRWNWSPVAKLANSAALVLLIVTTGSVTAGLVAAVTGLVVKVASLVRLSWLLRPATFGGHP